MERELQVWQRVCGAGRQEPDLRGLELRCRESAAVVQVLAEGCTGQLRQRLAGLHSQLAEEAMMLRGLRILGGEEPEKLRNYSAGQVSLRRGLAQCCQRCRQNKAELQEYLHHREYGDVFALLDARQTRHLGELLALIGMGT